MRSWIKQVIVAGQRPSDRSVLVLFLAKKTRERGGGWKTGWTSFSGGRRSRRGVAAHWYVYRQFRSSGAPKIVVFWCSDWPKLVTRYFASLSLHVILKTVKHTAARCCCNKQQHKTPRAQQYTSLLVPCAQKVQCQALPDNPETGDTYHVK